MDVRTMKPETGSVARYWEIQSAVLKDPNIADCTCLARRSEDGDDELILYWEPSGPVNQADLLARLREVVGEGGPTMRLVPLVRLPFRPDGSLDERALESIPVLDEPWLASRERLLRQRLGVKQVLMIAAEPPPEEVPGYHLTDLHPAADGRRPDGDPKETPAADAAVRSARTGPPAIVSVPAVEADRRLRDMTLVEVLRETVERRGDGRLRFIAADGALVEWTYLDLWHQAERIQAGLSELGLRPGDRVILQLVESQDILSAFWACQMGGLTPVIVEVPMSYERPSQALDRLLGLIRLLGDPTIIGDGSVVTALACLDDGSFPRGIRVQAIGDLRASGARPVRHQSRPEDIALLNLSSGSTGVPKGIMLSHRNLLTRAQGTNRLCPYSSRDLILNWLPLDHIGSLSDWHIRCVLLGCELIYVDKEYVLRDPMNWLTLIDRFRVTHSWAPSFAFALVNKQLSQSPPSSLDLSCVQGLLTAGEAVSDRSVLNFARAASRYGLRSTTIWPAFGMAELASGITYQVPTKDQPLRFHRIRQPSLGDRVEAAEEGQSDAAAFADLGPPIPGVTLRILDSEDRPLPVDCVGRVQVRGDMVFQGYLGNPEATASALRDGWLDTGDLGFLSEGRLVLTGREKETIIVNGANYACHEIESAAEGIEGLEPSFTAACGARRAGDDDERLALFFVPDGSVDEGELIRSIRTRIATRFGITPTYLVPLEKPLIPKTGIGKIQRTQLARGLASGEFDARLKRIDQRLGNANTLPSWFYRRIWVAKRASGEGRYPMPGATLILMDEAGLGRALAHRLRALGQTCVEIRTGVAPVPTYAGAYRLDSWSKASFLALMRQLREAGVVVGEILDLLDYRLDQAPTESPDELSDRLTERVAAFLYTVQAVLETGAAVGPWRLILVGNDCQALEVNDQGSPAKAMMTGFIQSLRLEQALIDARHIDLPWVDDQRLNSDLLLAELNALSKDPLVAYRHGERRVARLRRLDLVAERQAPVVLKSGGFYLISGGLGGLGFELCRWLGRICQARLLIVQRDAFDLETDPADRLSSPDQAPRTRYLALRDEGIDCALVFADIADEAAVRDGVARAEAGWGRALDGIFHLAGMAHERSVAQESPESFLAAARAKILGTRVLTGLLSDRPATFLVAFSSVNASFGGSSTGGYSAANAYLEADCHRSNRFGLRVHSYAWSPWDGLGMSREANVGSIAAAKGFRPLALDEGLRSLLALLNTGQSEAIVGLDDSKRPVRRLLTDADDPRPSVIAYLELGDGVSSASLPQTRILRDRFGTQFDCRLEVRETLPSWPADGVDRARLAAILDPEAGIKRKPSSPTEEKLLAIWSRLLETRDIGIQDSFFDLGGDSLSAVRLVAEIETEFGLSLPVSTVFHATTIEALAGRITAISRPSDWFSLVPIKPEGSRPPIFVVQSSSWDLARYLDQDQPLYGLNYGVGARGEESIPDLPARLEDLAAHYVAEVLGLQPRGPYLLIGHSAAGLVAYEMARQLSALGQGAPLVGLIDTYYPTTGGSSLFGKMTKGLAILSNPARMDAPIKPGRWIAQRLRHMKTLFASNKSDLPISLRARRLYDNYEPRSYSGSLVYWKCVGENEGGNERGDDLKWLALAGGSARIHPIPCNHYEIMKHPHARTVAEQIGRHAEILHGLHRSERKTRRGLAAS